MGDQDDPLEISLKPPPDIAIRRGRVDSIELYEITASELDKLEEGSPVALQLNFSVFFLSTGISFLTVLLTTRIDSDRKYYTFVTLTAILIIAGVVLGAIWFRQRRSNSTIIRRIRSRLP